MKFSLLFVVISVAITLFTTGSRVSARDIKDYVGQQPLLFGRRGLNPNMNSLFFGKRGIIDSGVSIRELKNACSMLLTYLDEAETIGNEEV